LREYGHRDGGDVLVGHQPTSAPRFRMSVLRPKAAIKILLYQGER
jgi:hypothetical protein